jgi:hypothetical protein
MTKRHLQVSDSRGSFRISPILLIFYYETLPVQSSDRNALTRLVKLRASDQVVGRPIK